MALASRLNVPSGNQDEEDPEDIFSSNLNTLFTDTTVNSHGWPGASIVYSSPAFGDIVVGIPEQPEVSESRTLFAHYLWNAALVTAEAIQAASRPDQESKGTVEATGWNTMDWDRRYWNVRACNVLELGAGTALPSLVAALSGANQVTITDHPSSPAITTGTIATNVFTNVVRRPKQSTSTTQEPSSSTSSSVPDPQVSIFGYLWGTSTFITPPSPSPSATATEITETTLPQPQPALNSFTKILIADCLWMPSKHASIIKTILSYLACAPPAPVSDPPSSHGPAPCALLTAGFHTGRGIVSDFLVLATGQGTPSAEIVAYDPVDESDPLRDEVRGSVQAVELFEIDVDGNKRGWKATRPEESRDEAKRWCVCAVLVRR